MRLWAAVWLVLCLALVPVAGLAQGQSNFSTGTAPAQGGSAEQPLDYGEWEQVAAATEGKIADPATSAIQLEQQRALLSGWRARFLTAQGTNSARIATLRTQIEALGAPPAEGETENPEVAERRVALDEQLFTLQAPSISAVEAYSRADGLIREIDRVLRERQADELLQLWPSPVNPANWPEALRTLSGALSGLVQEVQGNWASSARREQLIAGLPVILGLLALAGLTILRGRGWIEHFVLRLQERASIRGRAIWALLASLGQVIVPVLGVLAVAEAALASGMLGPIGGVVAEYLVAIGITIFAARWLGEQVFPKSEFAVTELSLNAALRTEGRVYAAAMGLVLALRVVLDLIVPASNISQAAASVLIFPVLVVGAILLFRMGQMLRRPGAAAAEGTEPPSYRNRLLAIVGRIAMAMGVAGPVLAAIGYVVAGENVVFPAIVSLGLLALLLILQRLVGDIYALITRNDDHARDALVPVLIGFILTLAAIPLFALIWGARLADISEVFTRLREGFQIGQTRISPSDFLLLAVVFGAGFLATRLFQGALKSSILPKTSLDQGGQNAIVAGLGYVGIFLSGLIAINATGLDLSGLAIVAGALSVGIGFGLQNIVSNFVSGIILLIERPVSEGDWIEVGGVQGTVRSISVRSTRIQTFDRTDVIVPNADLVSGMVTNWTRFNLSGRLIVKVGVAYGTDTRKVEAILQAIAEAQPLAVLNPPPVVVLAGFGADSLDFEIRVILRDVNFLLAVRSEINHEIARRFAEEGIEIPFGQRDIWLRNPEALRAIPAAPAPVALPEPGTKRRRPAKDTPT